MVYLQTEIEDYIYMHHSNHTLKVLYTVYSLTWSRNVIYQCLIAVAMCTQLATV